MSYSDYRLRAREVLSGNWTMAVIVTFVAAIFGALMSGSSFSLELDEETISQLPDFFQQFLTYYLGIASVLSIIQFIFGGAVRQGYVSYLLKLHRGEETELKDLFSQFNRFGDGFLLALLEGIFVVLWMLLFIIPGIVAAFSYAMAPYIMLEHPELTPNECLKASKEMMKGHKGELFVLELTFFGWILLNTLTLGIGSLWLNPYMNATHAAFYLDISAGAVPAANTAPTLNPAPSNDALWEE